MRYRVVKRADTFIVQIEVSENKWADEFRFMGRKAAIDFAKKRAGEETVLWESPKEKNETE